MSRDVILFGDSGGIRDLLAVIPPHRIKMIIGAERRPQYLDDLKHLADNVGAEFCLHPFARNYEAVAQFSVKVNKSDASYVVINSYSMRVPASIVGSYRGKMVNVHYSLLPMNRGPHPENWALIHGHEKTGVTLHHVSSEIDTGSVILQKEVAVDQSDTWVSLLSRLTLAAHDHVLPYIGDVVCSHGIFEPGVDQDFAEVTSNHALDADYPRLDPAGMTDRQMFNLIRAQVFPLKGAYYEGHSGRHHIDYYVPLSDIPALRLRIQNMA